MSAAATGSHRERPPYPSDVSAEQWRRIAPLLPPDEKRGRRRSTDLREVVNGINYRWSTGCVWRMLPHDFPPWATVYTYFRRWRSDGTLPVIREELLKRRGRPPGRLRDRGFTEARGRSSDRRRSSPASGRGRSARP